MWCPWGTIGVSFLDGAASDHWTPPATGPSPGNPRETWICLGRCGLNNAAGKYKFDPLETGYKVSLRGKVLGEILPMKEATGRHCFYLGFDERKKPRTYRGKIKAAEALEAINKLVTDSKKKKWTTEALIVNSWDERPRASDQW